MELKKINKRSPLWITFREIIFLSVLGFEVAEVGGSTCRRKCACE